MRSLPLTILALTLGSSGALAQVLVPIGQDRHVYATAQASDGSTIVTDTDADQAADFGPFVSSVAVNVDAGLAFGMSGAAQDSQILSASFVAQGSASGSSSGSSSTTDAYAESIASVDFDVTTKVQYHITGSYSGYDQGYASYFLTTTSGDLITGELGISEGLFSVDVSGLLQPGSYRMLYAAESYGGPSSGTGFAFADFDLTLELTPVSGTYCVGAPNSFGPGAELSIGGTQSIAANDFHVEATGAVPGEFAVLFYGAETQQVPFGDGFLCISGQLFRVLPAVQIDGAGFVSRQVDFTTAPASSGAGQILPTSTWNFQLWYRDPTGPLGTGFNASNGLWVTFCP